MQWVTRSLPAVAALTALCGCADPGNSGDAIPARAETATSAPSRSLETVTATTVQDTTSPDATSHATTLDTASHVAPSSARPPVASTEAPRLPGDVPITLVPRPPGSTSPYTLPDPYPTLPPPPETGAPRETFPLDAELPDFAWTVQDDLAISFDTPPDFRQIPYPTRELTQYDIDNGLYLLERWRIPSEATFCGFTVQRDPGDQAPQINRQQFAESVVRGELTWYLYDNASAELTGQPSNRALSRIDGYIIYAHGSPDGMRRVIDAIGVRRLP